MPHTHPAASVTIAVRRMRAIIATFDDDLARLDALLARPLATTVLTREEWTAAQAARAKVEKSVRSLKESATETARQASDWRKRAATADAEHRAYVAELEAVREFLGEWDERVKSAE